MKGVLPSISSFVAARLVRPTNPALPMKPTRRVCLLRVPLVLGGLLLLNPMAAHAGSWALDVGFAGTNLNGDVQSSSFSTLGQTQMKAPEAWAMGEDWVTGQSCEVNPASGVTLEAKSSGHYILQALWTPAFTGDRLPPSVTLKYQYDVQARCNALIPGNGSPGTALLHVKVNQPTGDPLTDPVGDTGSQHTEILPNPNYPGYPSYMRYTAHVVEPYHLLTLSTQNAVPQGGGKYLLTQALPDVEVKAQATGESIDGMVNGRPMVNGHYYIAPVAAGAVDIRYSLVTPSWSPTPAIGHIPQPPINGVAQPDRLDGRMTAPQDQRVVPATPAAVVVKAGDEVPCAVEAATDLDTSTLVFNGVSTVNTDPDSVTYTWSAKNANGSPVLGFKTTGSNTLTATSNLQNPTWVAPSNVGAYCLQCQIDDKPATIGSDETGSRNDTPIIRWVTVYVPALTFNPSPDNLALDDCSIPSRTLNQYVIDKPMPTSIGYSGVDALFGTWLKNNVSWNLQGTAPALEPAVTILTTSSSVMPGNYPPPIMTTPPPGPAPTPYPGFDFAVRTSSYPVPSTTSSDGWNFPSSNSSFGVKTFNHVVAGRTTPAPIALFYPATGTQHPYGGPKGYYYGYLGTWAEIDTPNWFYYYSQAWTAPCTVNYDLTGENGMSYFDPANPDHVNVTNDSHGSYSTPVFEKRPGYAYVQQVGAQMHYGIDNFVAAVTHEFTHKKIDQMINDGAIDTDGDHLPDVLEQQAGLNRNGSNSSLSGFTDEEVYCKIQELNAEGPKEADWADDGLNHGTVPGGCPRNRHPITYTYAP